MRIVLPKPSERYVATFVRERLALSADPMILEFVLKPAADPAIAL